MNNLKNRVAVITGAGSGIGQALAIALAEKGTNLALVDIDEEGLKKTQQKLSQFPVKVSLHIADVTDPE